MNRYYQRQTLLSDVGEEGQKRLNKVHVLVIGAGGLGCPALTYLASAGIGKLTIYDADQVEETNLHRQTIYNYSDIGESKALLAKEYLKERNPNVLVEAINKRFDEKTNLEEVDIIVDCSDNLKTKFIANDLAKKYHKVFCVASIHHLHGQLNFYDFKSSQLCFRSVWPQEPTDSQVMSCSENGIIGAFVGILGSIQAAEVIKYILKLNYLSNQTSLLFDFNTMEIDQIKSRISPKVKKVDYESLEIEFKKSDFDNFQVFNISNQSIEFKCSQVDKSDVIKKIRQLEKNEKIAILCNQGISSLGVVKQIREEGYLNAYSISGGISAIRASFE